jgi:hypothetical protein
MVQGPRQDRECFMWNRRKRRVGIYVLDKNGSGGFNLRAQPARCGISCKNAIYVRLKHT